MFSLAHTFNPEGAGFASSCSRAQGHCRAKHPSVLMGAAQRVGCPGQEPVLDSDLPRVVSSSPGCVLTTRLPSTACTHHACWEGSDLIVNKLNELKVIRDALFGAQDAGVLSGLRTRATSPSSRWGRVLLPELRLNHLKDTASS